MQALGVIAQAILESRDRILDRLEPLSDGAHAPRQPLDLSRRGQAGELERELLRVRRATARLERRGDDGVEPGAVEEVLGDPPDHLLAARAKPLTQALLARFLGHAS